MTGPHHGWPVERRGEPLATAKAAMILLHGRGATAHDILSLVDEIDTEGFAYLAPQAAGYTWYPYSFLAPIDQNEPGLSSALQVISDLLAEIEAAGIPAERTMILGFSQGACLTLEYTARHARRYGGIVGLTGGLIGPQSTSRDYPGLLDGTPILVASSDPDPHIPVARVKETVIVLDGMGATVEARLYPNMGHTINADEVAYVREMMANLVR
ncbi:MAG: dienelactone hydrolase family protein [Chloroflexi bacterium]|nr:dienelactone hydrolase family protein [Chloroflexota bacterium]